MKKKILYIDMDGVVANFEKEMNINIPNWRTMSESEVDEKVTEMCLNNPNIFHNLEPMEGAIETVKRLFEHFEVYFLSTPMWKSPESFTGKRLWIEEHFGDLAVKRLILSHRKDLNIGDYLIDDRTHNGAGEFLGEHIHFGTKDFPNWKSVYDYFVEENPYMKPEEDVEVLVSKCKKCGKIVTSKVKHVDNDNYDFYDEAKIYNLDIETQPLLEFRESNLGFCDCEDEIQVRVIEHNDNEGETFSYVMMLPKETIEKLKEKVDEYDPYEYEIEVGTTYTPEKVRELNKHVDNGYMDYIGFYELRTDFDEEIDIVENFEDIFYKANGLKEL